LAKARIGDDQMPENAGLSSATTTLDLREMTATAIPTAHSSAASEAMLDHAAPRQEYAGMIHKLIRTLKIATPAWSAVRVP